MKLLDFEPKPGIAYRYLYQDILRDIKAGKVHMLDAVRKLVLADLWFVVYFIMEMKNANHPFVVNACKEVEEGPKDKTIDIWSREHLKTSIITIGETIQEVLKNPESTHCIFAYVKPVAKKFLFTIKEIFSRNKLLIACFPDVLYENPERDAPLWSLDEGIIVRRKTNRREPTVAASGLTEGMATGMHYDRRVYDDIVTEDIGQSMDVMEDVKLKFDSSQNLGADGGSHRVIGTFYHYDDPLVYIRDKVSINDPGKSAYLLRLKPATEDGTPNGKPIFLSQERLDDLKLTKTFRIQQLLNPAPEGTKKFNNAFLKFVSGKDLPPRLFRFHLVDPSGKKGTGDPWASIIIGVDPDLKDVRLSKIYLLRMLVEKMPHTQAIKTIVDMYRTSGKIEKFCVENVAQSTTEVHISGELKTYSINISEENGRVVIFTPSGRHKTDRIEAGISWHLDNGKIHVLDSIETKYIEAFKRELSGFPFTKDDHCIDILSYFILDLLPHCRFRRYESVPLPDNIPMGAFL